MPGRLPDPAVNRLAEWRLERAMRRSTGARERFEGFAGLAPPGPVFVALGRLGDPPVGAREERDARRIDAGRPRGCRATALGLLVIALFVASASVAVVVVFVGLAFFAGP